jgi:phage replication-related protein YjqB (UPF0714/DUF867 family)
MMRKLVVIAAVVGLATTAAAQQRQSMSEAMLQTAVSSFVRESRASVAALSRDAGIVAALTAATSALDGFQKNNAFQSALDQMKLAKKLATENPAAAPETQRIVGNIDDLLRKESENASGADLVQLRHEIGRRMEPIQRTLFNEADEVRRRKEALSSAQMQLFQSGDEIDKALTAGLGAAIDYLKWAK